MTNTQSKTPLWAVDEILNATGGSLYFPPSAHPNNTTKGQLQTLFDCGFTRVSFGVQDYNLKVQEAIHRLQPFEAVAQVTKWSREIGYTSVSHDLIFGLPFKPKKT